MSESAADRKPLSPIQLAENLRIAARERELAADIAAGHDREVGISPLSIPYKRVQFDPN